jgi:hypothetical protein
MNKIKEARINQEGTKTVNMNMKNPQNRRTDLTLSTRMNALTVTVSTVPPANPASLLP